MRHGWPRQKGGLGISFGGRLLEFGPFPLQRFRRPHVIAAFSHVLE
jgi:hypothetical protein